MEKTYSVILIDDEISDIEKLRSSLRNYPAMIVVGVASDANSAESLILRKRPDLIFLDIELPFKSGLELLSDIRDKVTWGMKVIFYTSYMRYLLNALRESAFDFLLKPYGKEDFETVMNRFLTNSESKRPERAFSDSLSSLLPRNQTTFMVATITGYQILRLEQIGYFEHVKGDKQWYVVLHDQSRLQLRRNTTAEDILGYSPVFVQVNQQIIINLNYLTMIDGRFCVLEPPFDQRRDIVVSRHFFKVMQKKVELM
ncbi:LytTR family DNA-binding domain-containing protein [uncultured Parabacteroides sp.]|uniref:LytR/AlgR family response regulator transcription factor n=1 Tax=uncultured Parabacteroides sp. TaxID=512312 RepID=UPI0026397BA4|nr:LytTR family DNA-binding domain-containing protein [uncultured Parabacteroides sp.]